MQVVFVVFPGLTQLDFTAPAQVFSRLPDAMVHVAARSLAPISTGCGFGIAPSKTFKDCPQADLLCVPGGFGTAEAIADTELVDFVAEQAKGAKYVTSVCTGALILGAAGLLKGRKATTHWAYTSLLAELDAVYEPGRVVTDGNLITGGGVTAGLDFALQVAAEVTDERYAQALQLGFEYDPRPPFVGGHPDRAPAELVERVTARYRDSVEQMRPILASVRQSWS